jgi:regulator of sigma E protease
MSLLYSFFSNTIVAFIILIGIVVFVHELGHFIAGKIFGIRVEEFSIGFGPKAFGFKKNHTEYRINWLPLGGYVRFYGSDPSEPLSKETQHQSLLHAKLYKRAIVSFAGPFANFFLSFLIMLLMSWHGFPDQPSIISVLPDSVAENANLQTGDKIIAIDGKEVKGWSDLVKIISQSGNKKIHLSFERQGKTEKIYIAPAVENAETIYGTKEPSGRIGISPIFSKPAVSPQQNDFFSVIEIPSHDEIISINGIQIHYLYEVFQVLEKVTGANSDFSLAQKINAGILNSVSLNFIFKSNKKIAISFSSPQMKNWAKNITLKQHLKWNQSVVGTDQTVSGFSKLKDAQNPWQSCGLKTGDTIRSVENYGSITSPAQIAFWLEDISKKHSQKQIAPAAEVGLTLTDSNGVLKKLHCKIPFEKGLNHLNQPKIYLNFPVTFVEQPTMYPSILIKSTSFVDGIQKGFSAFTRQTSMIYNGLKMLVSGHIPLSNLGGPIAVAGIAGDAAKAGFIAFLFTLSMISVNIGMVNLLPLPALDGGTLLLHLVEALYGKPLPQQVQITVQRIGIFVILSLFVLVFYNDLIRLFHF